MDPAPVTAPVQGVVVSIDVTPGQSVPLAPMGLIANNPAHLGGAIDADGADKALSAATVYEIDDVIDPVAIREWIGAAVRGAPRRERRIPRDTW